MTRFLYIIALLLLGGTVLAQTRKAKTHKAKPRKTTTYTPPPAIRETKDTFFQDIGVGVSPDPKEAPSDASRVFTVVDQMPEFRGGIPALRQYLGKNINYPSQAVEDGIQGQVVVEFTVCEDGRLCNEKVVRSIGGGCDQEALRVIRAMPSWKPGKKDGKAVKVYYRQPITFMLIEDEPVKKD